MSFLTSFLTGGIQRQLDRWGEQDAAIAERISKLGDAIVTADDNASQKVDKLSKVAGVLNSKYGKNGIYQLAYQVDNNAIDFNDDVDDIAERVSKFEIPEDYIKSIANPYDYLGEQTQSMYSKDMQAYNTLASNLSMGDKTSQLLIPKRDYTTSYAGLQEAPTIGAKPITSAMPGISKSDIENNAYSKLAFLVQNRIPLADAMNPKYEKFALDELEMNFIKNEIKDADSAQDILNNILIHASEEYAGAKFLTEEKPEDILKGINEILALGDFDKAYTTQDNLAMEQDIEFQNFINQGNVYSNFDALSNYQKNLPRVFVDMDTLSNEEANKILDNIEEGTIIEFKKNGQNFFVES